MILRGNWKMRHPLAACLAALLLSLPALAQTPKVDLQRAIATSDPEAIKALLASHEGLARDKIFSGQSALWLTVETTQSLPVARALLDGGADPNEIMNGKPLLHRAAETRSSELVELILASGCNPKITDAEGCSALNHAEVPATLKVLTTAGLDPNKPNNAGSTPLHSNSGRPDCVRFLIKGGALLNSQDKWGRTPLYLSTCTYPSAKLLVDEGARLEIADRSGNHPLHFACGHGHLETITLLLNKGASPNVKDAKGSTPLHHLMVGLRDRLQQGMGGCGSDGKPRQMTDEESKAYKTVVRLMKKRGLDKNIKDQQGTALELIASIKTLGDFATFLRGL